MKRSFLLAVVGVMSVVLGAGCAKVSDAQQGDIANIVGGLSNQTDKPNGVSLTEPDSEAGSPSGLVRQIHRQIEGALWLVKFSLQGNGASGLSPYGGSGCPSGTISVDNASCTYSCPSDSVLKESCTTTGSVSDTCAGTRYTYDNESFSLTYDVSGITSSSGSNTGTLGVTLGFGADVTGGALDGKTLSCTIGLSFDIAKIDAGTPQSPTLDCGNFTCTYDDKNVDCDKLQSDFGNGEACTAS